MARRFATLGLAILFLMCSPAIASLLCGAEDCPHEAHGRASKHGPRLCCPDTHSAAGVSQQNGWNLLCDVATIDSAAVGERLVALSSVPFESRPLETSTPPP